MKIALNIFDLDDPQPVQIPEGNDGVRILVRKSALVLGWIYFQNHGPLISVEALLFAARQQLGKELADLYVREALIDEVELTAEEPISVVICTRDRTELLRQCLARLLQLEYSTFEIIVIDNAPTDDSCFKLVSATSAQYIREPRPGLDRARNAGIRAANFSIVAFIDDDALADQYWLHRINNAFRDPRVAAVSGFVAPLSLQTRAEQIFEFDYGGMAHGTEKKYFNRQWLNEEEMLWSSGMGIGANMAFRRSVFGQVGYFDESLDVGTPTSGGGDIEFFHRLVSGGLMMLYDPSVLIFHQHRKETKALARQVYQNGKGFGAYLLRSYGARTVSRSSIIQFFFKNWLWNWNGKNLVKAPFPRKLSLLELKGILLSPFFYLKSKKEAG